MSAQKKYVSHKKNQSTVLTLERHYVYNTMSAQKNICSQLCCGTLEGSATIIDERLHFKLLFLSLSSRRHYHLHQHMYCKA